MIRTQGPRAGSWGLEKGYWELGGQRCPRVLGGHDGTSQEGRGPFNELAGTLILAEQAKFGIKREGGGSLGESTLLDSYWPKAHTLICVLLWELWVSEWLSIFWGSSSLPDIWHGGSLPSHLSLHSIPLLSIKH